jgi:flagellar biosynthesis protein FlhF
VIALIGPPGSGKTSVAVRIAVSYGLALDRPVVFLAADDHRVGADAKLQQFAALLGVEYAATRNVADLREQINTRDENTLILIDTPGLAPGELDQAEKIATFLAQRRDIQKHLVLPATMKSDDMQAAIERFEIFGTDRLLFTRLDETDRLGPAFSEAAASRKPISFLTVGQQVPGDMMPARDFSLPALLGNQKQKMLTAA